MDVFFCSCQEPLSLKGMSHAKLIWSLIRDFIASMEISDQAYLHTISYMLMNVCQSGIYWEANGLFVVFHRIFQCIKNLFMVTK